VAGYSEQNLSDVQARRLRGQRTKQFADRAVSLYSDSENRQLESDIRRDLSAQSQRRRQFLVVASKGF
jgi:hypothetical protein